MTATNTPDPADSHQASEDEQNKRDIIASLANDYYDQLKNEAPYINMKFEELGAVCRDFAAQDVEALVRTENKKLLAAVMERVIGGPSELDSNGRYNLKVEQRAVLQQIMEELDHE